MKLKHKFEIGQIINGRRIIEIKKDQDSNKLTYLCICINCKHMHTLKHDSLALRSTGKPTPYCVHCRQKIEHGIGIDTTPETDPVMLHIDRMPASRLPMNGWRY